MKYTVLVVEDERDQRRALIERVDWESAGFEVAGEAENGGDGSAVGARDAGREDGGNRPAETL